MHAPSAPASPAAPLEAGAFDAANRAGWDRIYDAGEALLEHPDEALVSYLHRTMKRDPAIERVLDAGCGAGRHVLLLARAGYRVSGVDISPAALHHARARLQRDGLDADLRTAAAEDLPLASASFDAVLSWGVLNNLAADAAVDRALREAMRVLRPGGTLIISLCAWEDGKHTPAARPLGGNLHEIPYGDGRMYVRFWSRDEAVALLEQRGWQVERVGFVLRHVDFDPREPVAYHTIAARSPKAAHA